MNKKGRFAELHLNLNKVVVVLDNRYMPITVVYDSNKISVEKIRTLIAQLGFDADQVKADPKAVAKLDECCQKPS